MTRPAIVNSRGFARTALFGTSSGSNNQVLASGSNGETFWSPFVRTITADGSNYLMNPDVNFASGSNIVFTFDAPPIGGGSLPSNTVRIHSTGGGGGATLSYGSNATRVSEDSSAGVNASVSRSDHRHDGIGTITASSSNTMQRGTWNLRAGTGIALALTDTDGDGEFDTTTIINTGSGGGGGGAGSSSGLVLLEQHTASSSASLDFTTRNASGQSGATFQSDFDEYLIEFVGIIPATDGAVPYLRLSTNGGSSYDASGIYDWAYFSTAIGTTSTGGAGAANQTQFDLFNAGIKSAATPSLTGSLRLFDPLNASNHKRFSGLMQQTYSGDGFTRETMLGCIYKSTTAVDALRFLMSSGNITSGTIRIYGIPK